MDFLEDCTRIIERARAAGVRIATAESCTGGLIFGALTDVAGSSAVMDRGFVTYSYAAKTDMLGVSRESLEQFGAVSDPVARQMAQSALENADAHMAIAVTGVAGPGASDAKPEGMVCFALAQKDRPTIGETVQFGAIGRQQVRGATIDHALKMMARALPPIAQ